MIQQRVYFCFLELAFLLSASSFSLTFMALFSASANKEFHSLFLTIVAKRSVSAGSFSKATLNLLSASSSLQTRSRASSGQNSTHLGSPSQRSHATALPVSE